jgi:hypothetical protein
MATKINIEIDQGATFMHVFSVIDNAQNPYDLTGYTAQSQMKRWYSSAISINLGATVNVSTGSVELALAPIATSNIASGRYVYDVMLTDPFNNINRIAEGEVRVNPGVTNSNIETTPNTYNANVNYVVVPLLG